MRQYISVFVVLMNGYICRELVNGEVIDTYKTREEAITSASRHVEQDKRLFSAGWIDVPAQYTVRQCQMSSIR